MSHWARWTMGCAASALTSSTLVAASLSAPILVPDQYTVRTGGSVTLFVEEGDPLSARRVDWPSERMDWFFVRAAGTQENQHNPRPVRPENGGMDVSLSQPDTALIGFDLRSIVTKAEVRELRDFLKRRLAPADFLRDLEALPAEGKVRVRLVHSAKTLVRVDREDGPASPSATAQSKSGQAVEIRLLADPTRSPLGSDLPVRAYIGGDKKAGLRMFASNLNAGASHETITDSSGSGFFPLTRAGVWRIEFHHAERLNDDPEADWVIYGATLTFQVGAVEDGR